MRYTKKPVTIEAIRFVSLTELGDPYFDLTPNGNQLPQWLIDAISEAEGQPGSLFTSYAPDFKAVLHIGTLEGLLTVADGDWIIRGVQGELYPCKPDIFEATYSAERPPIETDEGESAGDMLQRLGMDGKLWAEEFCRKFENHVIREKGHGIVDVALMIGWFANAIMAGYDRGHARGFEDALTPAAPELEQAMEDGKKSLVLDMQQECVTLRQALAKAETQFLFYAAEHSRKEEAARHKAGHAIDSMTRENRLEDAMEAARKAQVNRDYASMCRTAIDYVPQPLCPKLEAFHETGVALLDQPGTFTIGHGFGTIADSDGNDGA
ncbi:hypothetical protein [Sphingobium yanoikuyae]|uniref:hypothetical protein n=1 Tax=Sphingobium yanoikuyae TaxID=13690 RepID=UPI0035C770F8